MDNYDALQSNRTGIITGNYREYQTHDKTELSILFSPNQTAKMAGG